MADFKYDPLSDPGTQIRLLLLQPGNWTDPIVASLRVESMDNSVSYEAMSYTWGAESPLLPIAIADTSMMVRTNCWTSLQQVRLRDRERAVWIDSICINQNDLDEKEAQVHRIGDIFRKATCVLASLGAHADDSEFLLNFGLALDYLFTYVRESVDKQWLIPCTNLRLPHEWRSVMPDHATNAVLLAIWHDKPVQLRYLRRLLDALYRFQRRAYWNRLWIRPELYLAADVKFHCGRLQFREKILTTLRGFVSEMLETTEISQEFWESKRDIIMREDIDVSRKARISSPLSIRSLRVHSMMNMSEALTEIGVREFHGHQQYTINFARIVRLGCSDPRDKIYAFLPIVDQRVKSAISVSYRKIALDLALEAVGVGVLKKSRGMIETSLPFCSRIGDLVDLLQALEIGCPHENTGTEELMLARSWNVRSSFGGDATFGTRPCQCNADYHRKRMAFKTSRYFRIVHGVDGTLQADVTFMKGSHQERMADPEPYPTPAVCGLTVNIRGSATSSWPDRIIGAFPWNVIAGDIVAAPFDADRCDQCVILRPSHSGFHTMIGQGLCRETRNMIESPSFWVLVEPEDALAMALKVKSCSHDSNEQNVGASGLPSPDYRRLDIPFTRTKYSSYAIEDVPEAMAKPSLCWTCGGLLSCHIMDLYSSVAARDFEIAITATKFATSGSTK